MTLIDTVRAWLQKGEFGWDGRTDRWDDLREETAHRSRGQKDKASRTIATVLDRVTGWFVKMFWPGRLFLTGSLSSLANGLDFTEATGTTSVQRMVEFVQDTCSDLGVSFNPDDARLSRADIAGDYDFGFPADLLLGEIGRLGQIGTMKQQVDPERYGHPYARFGNTQRQHVFYPKPGGYLRSEHRLMHTSVCERHGLYGFHDLEHTDRLTRIWVDANDRVLKEAVRIGIFGEQRDIQWGTAEKVAALLRTPNVRVTEALRFYSMTGLTEFLAEIGGVNHLDSWVSHLGIPAYRKKRFLDYLTEILRAEMPASTTSAQVWGAFEQWIDRERQFINEMEHIDEKTAI